ncbi:hypothetical protein [Paenibacillus pinihumi]|uniref:hypothetical protein n=1 Tax=Paenibacillus pinihumi TaxID=669462 RepID=UPI000406CAC0|nr:hypothetical protein [Paenibacillus pinihumi]
MNRLSDDELDQQKISRFLDPSHPLCRSDVIWILDWIKKKVAADNPSTLGLSQPQLWKGFSRFAEAAMLLIHCQRFSYDETDRLRKLLAEAVSAIRSPS